MITSLKVLTADEYYHVKDYDKSYVYVIIVMLCYVQLFFSCRLLKGVVEVYRTEQWWETLTTILLKLLKYVVANVIST